MKFIPSHYRLWLHSAAIVLALTVAVIPAILSYRIHRKMVDEEEAKMRLWANATEAIASDNESAPIDLLLSIISSNTSIPIILANDSNTILSFNNIRIPSRVDSVAFLQKKLSLFKKQHSPIAIRLSEEQHQYLYYGNSSTLAQLLFFPLIQTTIFIFFIAIIALAWWLAKRSAQNLLWIGLSKETAHQLGTPISSLMAWVELLKEKNNVPEICYEMEKDIDRLMNISHRFQKIGGNAATEIYNLNQLVEEITSYLQQRISKGVKIFIADNSEPIFVRINRDLMGWVLENIVKNGVDAMEGKGEITIHVERKNKHAILDITDTGKGIPRANRRNVFKPGFTTKKKGWGLGLSLAKRIVESPHQGKISILHTEVGRGTTFRIRLPLVAKNT